MAECCRCPYTTEIQRKFGVTTHCNLEPTFMDVSYYCSEKHRDEWNPLCPFENPEMRFRGVNYTKYETENLQVKEKQNEIL